MVSICNKHEDITIHMNMPSDRTGSRHLNILSETIRDDYRMSTLRTTSPSRISDSQTLLSSSDLMWLTIRWRKVREKPFKQNRYSSNRFMACRRSLEEVVMVMVIVTKYTYKLFGHTRRMVPCLPSLSEIPQFDHRRQPSVLRIEKLLPWSSNIAFVAVNEQYHRVLTN